MEVRICKNPEELGKSAAIHTANVIIHTLSAGTLSTLYNLASETTRTFVYTCRSSLYSVHTLREVSRAGGRVFFTSCVGTFLASVGAGGCGTGLFINKRAVSATSSRSHNLRCSHDTLIAFHKEGCAGVCVESAICIRTTNTGVITKSTCANR